MRRGVARLQGQRERANEDRHHRRYGPDRLEIGPLLRSRGHEVLQASPSRGVNAVAGEGLQGALAGADVPYFGVLLALRTLAPDDGVRIMPMRFDDWLGRGGGVGRGDRHRHCERSEAIHLSVHEVTMDCFASLAMTVDIVSPSRDALRPRFASSFGPLRN
jgi:hypothetical protein